MKHATDPRYTITIKRKSRLISMKDVHFCGQWIGHAMTMKGAECIVQDHLNTRSREDAEFGV